jgi:hypothetical protein
MGQAIPGSTREQPEWSGDELGWPPCNPLPLALVGWPGWSGLCRYSAAYSAPQRSLRLLITNDFRRYSAVLCRFTLACCEEAEAITTSGQSWPLRPPEQDSYPALLKASSTACGCLAIAACKVRAVPSAPVPPRSQVRSVAVLLWSPVHRLGPAGGLSYFASLQPINWIPASLITWRVAGSMKMR